MKSFFLLLLIALFVGCTLTSNNFVIEGKLASHQFDGEWLYLVPIKNPSAETVDSAKIENGCFTFKGTVERVSVLRTRPLLRFVLQPILVVTEPGNIKVEVDSMGIVAGTPQNTALQDWKEKKEKMNNAHLFISRSLSSSASLDSISLNRLQGSLKKQEIDYNYNFLKKQGNNTVGRFVFELVRPYFSKDQQRELDEIYK